MLIAETGSDGEIDHFHGVPQTFGIDKVKKIPMEPFLERKVFPDSVWLHVMGGGEKIRDVMQDYSQFFAELFIFFPLDQCGVGEFSDFLFYKAV